MNKHHRPQPQEAAKLFIKRYFPTCQGAILSGSVIRGEATSTSDLDIIIFDNNIPFPYRESKVYYQWPIEVFVHNLVSYKLIFKEDAERAIPTHPRMVAEGVAIVDHGVIEPIMKDAIHILSKGPEPWSEETIYMKRYFITDVLDDLLGATDRGEAVFSANQLADWLHEFVLRTNQQWLGDGKWIVRALKRYDKKFAVEFVNAFDTFYKTGNKEKIVTIVDHVLKPYGGRLFDGFSVGKLW